MNYRHAYHAGNFADVFKHLILTFAIQRLRQKDKPFRVIDTHAGVGRYDLTADQATRTGEWREGIGRLFAARQKNWPGMSSMLGADPTIAAYLAAIGATGANRYLDGNALNVYPGSPALARALLRPQDMLIVNELHPEGIRQRPTCIWATRSPTLHYRTICLAVVRFNRSIMVGSDCR
jgi:23S rRNA (adenine2030-N6)-methyltransferase